MVGCSESPSLDATSAYDGSDPSASGALPPISSLPSGVGGLSAVEIGSWGEGEAESAAIAPDGTLAVATSAKVVLVRPDAEPIDLERFHGPTIGLAIALDPSGQTVVVSSATPPLVRWFDVSTGELQQTQAQDVPYVDVWFDGPLLRARSLDGIAAWPGGPGTEAVGVHAPRSGSSDGAGGEGPSASLVVDENGTTHVEAIELPAGHAVLDVSGGALPDDSLAVLSGDPADPFGPRTISLLARGDAAPVASITVDERLESQSWVVDDGMTAVVTNGAVQVVDVDGRRLPELAADTDAPVSRLRAYGDALVAIHSDGTITAWSDDSFDPTTLRDGGRAVRDVALSADGAWLAVVGADGEVAVARPDGTPGSETVHGDWTGVLSSVAVDVERGEAALGWSNGRVSVLDESLAESATRRAGRPSLVDSIAFAPAGSGDGRPALVAALNEYVSDGTYDDTLVVWDDDGTERFRQRGALETIPGCSFFNHRIGLSPDATMLASASHDYTIDIVEPIGGNIVHVLGPLPGPFLDLAFTPGSDQLVVTTDDSMLRSFSTSDWSVVAELPTPLGGYLAFVLSPDGRTLLGTDTLGSLHRVDLDTGGSEVVVSDLGSRATRLAVSPDGALVAAPSAIGDVGVWNARTGERVAELHGHTRRVSDLAFSAERELITVSEDGTARRWSLV